MPLILIALVVGAGLYLYTKRGINTAGSTHKTVVSTPVSLAGPAVSAASRPTAGLMSGSWFAGGSET